MKYFVSFLAIIAISFAQLPVPIPSLSNISSINGEWYIVWTYDSHMEYPTDFEFSCYQWGLSLNSEGGQVDVDYSFYGTKRNVTFSVEFGASNSVWDEEYYWLAIDPINLNWATVGVVGTASNGNYSSGFILSRSPTLSNAIVNANVALLKGEKFPVTNQNVIGVKNTACY